MNVCGMHAAVCMMCVGVEAIIHTPLSLDGRKIEVKRAIPKDEIAPGMRGGAGGARGGRRHEFASQGQLDDRYRWNPNGGSAATPYTCSHHTMHMRTFCTM